MTALLVLATVVVFLLIDFFYGRRPVVQEQPARRPARPLPIEARGVPATIAGFKVPEHLRYHPGHAWALSESPNLVRVGVDDFAAKVLGKIDGVALPQRGQWVRQGQKLCSFTRNGAKVDMLSPIEGTVTDVNDGVLSNADMMWKDPYGEGWLITVHSPDAKTNFRNLLSGGVARWWTEEASNRLQRRLPGGMGAYAQDGGLVVDSLTADVNEEAWAELAREFFLS